ncbi:MAG: hypothetical protein HPY45_12030 [Anaerolineae bacterium]|nr:hypothetical protein [Anaerolineae bacterium]
MDTTVAKSLAALMPILPVVGDDRPHLEDAIRAFKDHGGRFVLAGGLSMAGVQARRSLEAAKKVSAASESAWRKLYHWHAGGEPSYGAPRFYTVQLGRLVRELCQKHGMNDRIPRYIGRGVLAVNKYVAEKLFLKMYELELEQQPSYRVWAYRKAAWSVDELPQSLTDIYQAHGIAGLMERSDIGRSIAEEIAAWVMAYISVSYQTEVGLNGKT